MARVLEVIRKRVPDVERSQSQTLLSFLRVSAYVFHEQFGM